jgi:hypothetical protein
MAKYTKEFEAWWLGMLTRHKYYKFTNAKDAASDAFKAGKQQGKASAQKVIDRFEQQAEDRYFCMDETD